MRDVLYFSTCCDVGSCQLQVVMVRKKHELKCEQIWLEELRNELTSAMEALIGETY